MNKVFSVLIISFLSALLLRAFVIEGFVVSGASMEPTLKSGDLVLVSKLSYKWGRQPQKNDVVVATPRGMQNKVIKRVAATPGEREDLGSGTVMLDPKEYFLLGDNRQVSEDSRTFGPVDAWQIEGRVIWALRLSEFRFIHP
jgi:signal peptidase I